MLFQKRQSVKAAYRSFHFIEQHNVFVEAAKDVIGTKELGQRRMGNQESEHPQMLS